MVFCWWSFHKIWTWANYCMTHIQLELQTSVPTKHSLVIMLKLGHPSNVTIEAVHQQDHHRQSVRSQRGLCLVLRCLLTYSFSMARCSTMYKVSPLSNTYSISMEKCSTMYRGTSWSNFLAAPGRSRIWHLVSGCIWSWSPCQIFSCFHRINKSSSDSSAI